MATNLHPSSAVLVVDDEVLVRMDVANTIEDAGYLVYEAGDADQAVRLLREHSDIGILFTDINMPGSMDGLQLARFACDRWPPLKLIISSGNSRPQDMPLGSVFLSKPCWPEQVVEAMRALAASKVTS